MIKHSIILICLFIVVSLSVNSQKRLVKKNLSLTENDFYIRNVRSGTYLDIPGTGSKARKSDGVNIQLWKLDSGQDRKFRFSNAGDGFYYIMPKHASVCLDVEGCWPGKPFCNWYKTSKGAPIQIWNWGTSVSFKWKLEQVSRGKFLIINKYSGKAMDAKTKQIHNNGCPVIQWTITREDIQLWELICVKTGARYEL